MNKLKKLKIITQLYVKKYYNFGNYFIDHLIDISVIQKFADTYYNG